MSRPEALILSRYYPNAGGGTAMRAARWVEALTLTHDVTFVVIEHERVAQPRRDLLDRHVLDRCRSVRLAPMIRDDGSFDQAVLARHLNDLSGKTFDLALTLRLGMFQAWAASINAGIRAARVWLDLDDIESETLTRKAQMYGPEHASPSDLQEAKRLEQLEAYAVDCYDMIFVCSKLDVRKLQARMPSSAEKFLYLPNVTPPAPLRKRSTPRAKSSAEILFIGSLNYWPNTDAVWWAAKFIIPQLQKIAPELKVNFKVAGFAPPNWMWEAHNAGELQLSANVDAKQLRELYADADAVLTPIRSGGGTRLKIIEAMHHGVPVVSTPLGAEGLEVDNLRHIIIADGAGNLAAGLAALLRGPTSFYDSIVREARALALERYSPAVVNQLISQYLKATP